MIPLLKNATHVKRRGELVEMQFMTRAATHGFTVSKPWGDTARYDFIVEHAGGLSRVQVKSTSALTTPPQQGYFCRIASRRTAKSYAPYGPHEIDFIAAYVIPHDAWFILPVELTARYHSSICLDPRRPHSKYGPYLEAWHLLRTAAAPG